MHVKRNIQSLETTLLLGKSAIFWKILDQNYVNTYLPIIGKENLFPVINTLTSLKQESTKVGFILSAPNGISINQVFTLRTKCFLSYTKNYELIKNRR